MFHLSRFAYGLKLKKMEQLTKYLRPLMRPLMRPLKMPCGVTCLRHSPVQAMGQWLVVRINWGFGCKEKGSTTPVSTASNPFAPQLLMESTMLASTSAEVTLAKMCPHPVLRHYYYLFIGKSIYWRYFHISSWIFYQNLLRILVCGNIGLKLHQKLFCLPELSITQILSKKALKYF